VTSPDRERPSLVAIDASLTAAGSPYEIEVREVRGVPTRVWKHAPLNLPAVLRASRDRDGSEFVVFDDERITYAENYRRAAALADALAGHFGVQKGDRVAIAMRNYPEWFTAFWGAIAAGAVVVPLNAWWSAPELAYGLKDSGAMVLIADNDRIERIADGDGTAGLRAVVAVRSESTPIATTPFDELLGSSPDGEDLPEIAIEPDDPATIFYTSGTTGHPKGALGTHRNMCSTVMCISYLATRTTALHPEAPAIDGQASSLLTVPLFHVTGCHGAVLGSLAAGSKVVMMHRWDPEVALDLIERERITTFSGVPAMALQLLDAATRSRRDTSSLRRILTGGAPAPDDQARRMRQILPHVLPGNAWGMTETSQIVTGIYGDDYLQHPGSSGYPVPVDELRVVDVDGRDVPAGEPGELIVRGPNIVAGYWNKPEASAATFVDGWLRTGDLAVIDAAGRLYIVDRIKDVIMRGGENIGSVEVESVLHEHPAVADAAVVGLPHAVLGEEVGAVVQLWPETQVTEAELKEHVAGRLASFKVPVRIWFWSEPLPRNPAGKVLKRDLREAVLADETH
jgi:steroid-24-oyl-CoA synthetase